MELSTFWQAFNIFNFNTLLSYLVGVVFPWLNFDDWALGQKVRYRIKSGAINGSLIVTIQNQDHSSSWVHHHVRIFGIYHQSVEVLWDHSEKRIQKILVNGQPAQNIQIEKVSLIQEKPGYYLYKNSVFPCIQREFEITDTRGQVTRCELCQNPQLVPIYHVLWAEIQYDRDFIKISWLP